MKTESPLKKHHFWLLFGLAPLLTLLGVSCISSGVGGKIAEREAEIKTAKDAIGGKQNPKPNALIEEAKKAYEKVSKKQGFLHEDNWNRQKHLFTWPEGSRLLRRFNEMNLKFGDPLPTNEGEFDEFKKNEVYLYEFSSIKKDGSGGPGIGMADRVAPTQFYGGWQRVLRHVSDFGQFQINKDQVWLMMEDIWVQRSLLDAVRSINVDLSTFRRGKADKDGNIVYDPSFDDAGYKIEGGKRVETPEAEKRKAVFRNRTWAVELELVREGGSQRLTGTLTNLSERLQLMGVGNVMTLNVWYSKDSAAQPIPFKIGGEFLPGKGATKRDPSGKDVPANVMPIVPIDDHILPAAMSAEEIVRVEQVFDIRTVPVKRIEALALGFRDSRNAEKPLVGPKSPPFAPDPTAATDAGTPNTGGEFGGVGSSGGPPAGMVLGGPGGRPGGPGGVGASSFPGAGNAGKSALMGGGPLAAVVDGNKKRYLEATDQVRRLPVGIVVVIDQAYMEDMLLAFANSPLRFQITQVTWTRFRGSLLGTGPSGGGASGPSGDVDLGSGTINFGGYGDPDAGPRPGMGSIGPRPMGGAIGTGAIGPGAIGPGAIGPRPVGGMPGTGGFGQFGSMVSTVSESQITSGLVELSVYGIVSLYEKFEAPKAPDAKDGTTPPATGPTTPTPMEPMTPAPAPAPGPMTPAPAPMPPKMRRRVRA